MISKDYRLANRLWGKFRRCSKHDSVGRWSASKEFVEGYLLMFEEFSQYHWRVGGESEWINFWPTTGKWRGCSSGKSGMGYVTLLEVLNE